MTFFRYATVDSSHLEKTNRLLARGWQPVRELTLADQESNGKLHGDYAVVLLKKEQSESDATDVHVANTVSVDDLADVPLLNGLDNGELQQLAILGLRLDYPADEVVFREGEEDRGLYILLDGEIQISLSELPFDDVEITRLSPKSVFGESTFFSAAPHSATVTCLSDVSLFRLTRDDYNELVQLQPSAAFQIAENAAKILAARLQETNEWLWQLLQSEQNTQVTASWRRFRERIRHVR